ncbi:MAG TPA: DUF1156 domain-containing protein [Chloroflexia bacterium]|nr:DUF1156 domain-containing protein [Chloroflexia bacterium]
MPAYRKKLIEVALPLDAINKEAAREKSIRHGHPSTLHLWWARRPLAAARAVLFASLVDDPGNDLPEAEAKKERDRLFEIIKQLVMWENVNNPKVLAEAHAEIMRSTNGNPPPVLDPFAGGGTIPLAAQQLGLQAYASDLNPVAVLINKALIEIPPKFAGRKPVHPEATADDGAKKHLATHQEAAVKSALAEDVRWYGKWMRDEAFKRIGHLYPKGPNGETVIAWLWARTVKCPNPACGARMPLVNSFWLATKPGKEHWIEPIIEKSDKFVEFEVREGKPPTNLIERVKNGTKTGRGANFECLVCNTTPDEAYIKAEGMAGRLSSQLLAVVTDTKTGRGYLSPNTVNALPTIPTTDLSGLEAEIANDPRNIWCRSYGLATFADFFTSRQLVALTTFSDLIDEVRLFVLDHSDGNKGYSDAVITYLAFALDKAADYWSSICGWHSGRDIIRNTFARQAIPMTWDYAEANPFSDSTGNFLGAVGWVAQVVEVISIGLEGSVKQLDATQAISNVVNPIVSTDPPYYDNISYADLSDFFYVWLRRSLNKIYPDLFSTLLTPKAPELVAVTHRFDGNKIKAQQFFESGLDKAFSLIRTNQHSEYPFTIYYSFKQDETHASTGWETMLEGLIRAGFVITGTWPIRTEMANRNIAAGTNALASSIVLVCRPRPVNAPMATRRDFQRALDKELPAALKLLTDEQVAPVDLAQATIGPGMAVFSRYSKVIEADGEPMRVRTALQLINRAIESFFAEMESDLDSETRFCLAWYRQQGSTEGLYGEADILAKAKNISIPMLQRAGILRAGQGKVKLLSAGDYPDDWNLDGANRITIWEATHRLVHAMQTGGDKEAGVLAARLGGVAEQGRALAYQLYDVANRKGWSADALGYNDLVAAWGGVQKYAGDIPVQTTLF